MRRLGKRPPSPADLRHQSRQQSQRMRATRVVHEHNGVRLEHGIGSRLPLGLGHHLAGRGIPPVLRIDSPPKQVQAAASGDVIALRRADLPYGGRHNPARSMPSRRAWRVCGRGPADLGRRLREVRSVLEAWTRSGGLRTASRPPGRGALHVHPWTKKVAATPVHRECPDPRKSIAGGPSSNVRQR